MNDDKPKSIWKKSWTVKILFVIACLITLVALFYAEEDWRGWHAWNKFKHQWEVRGVQFDRASVIPPAVPEDQNFAMTPIVASCYSRLLDKNGHQIEPPDTNIVDRLQMTTVDYNYGNGPAFGTNNWQKSTLCDLKAWQQYYRALSAKTNEFPVAPEPQSPAADVLLALSKYDSAIEELRQAARMPYSRFPVNYEKDNPADILLPHLATLKRCSQVLQLRAIAELQNGQTGAAFDDVKLMLYLADSVRTEPILISHLVRIVIVTLALQPVWEGLARHQWSDAQLVELENELGQPDFLAAYQLSLRSEMVFFGNGIFDFLRRHPGALADLLRMDNEGRNTRSLPKLVCLLIPNGWFYQNQLHYARPMVEFCLPSVDLNHRIISPEFIRRANAKIEADTKDHNFFNVGERMLLPALGAAANRFAYGQESVDLARVACALERYRLAHGEYPESLDRLVPQFIAKPPHDVIGGQPSHGSGLASQPLHYHRTPDGQFILYSVGWNETDDDGTVSLRDNGSVNRNKGDWVWRYPPK